MIDKSTIDKIFDSADVVEVVQDFMNLKKRGANYIGLCPFHNEKTPSFSVSPARGIYKCFGCGKGGNAVNFVMEHEQLSYYEALKFLAKKYNIEIVEKELTAEEIEEKNEVESLTIVTSFAQKYFSNNLKNTDEGKAIGLSYLEERGFRSPVVDKFQLGYSLEKWDDFTKTAEKNGYKTDYLVKTGLTIEKGGSKFDRFNGRVIFPIHSLSGKIIGFGGRILKKEAKAAKYLNSPESSIYHKSKSLYGIFLAKKAIVQHDKCYLVEGYTDVISMAQAGIENVVASSGTALTEEQIRMIKRFTHNITVIYDGDEAGLKASIRGIDLILEQGMNVKILVLPDGEDPDSYSKSVSSTELNSYIEEKEQDFINFKTSLLLKEAQKDPIKKAYLINDIVSSIAVIPESIIRSVYIKECSNKLNVDEKILYAEINKIRREKYKNRLKKSDNNKTTENKKGTKGPSENIYENLHKNSTEIIEKEIIRVLIKYTNDICFYENIEGQDGIKTEWPVTVKDYIIRELIEEDEIEFEHPGCRKIFEIFKQLTKEDKKNIEPREFINHPDQEISKLSAQIFTSGYTLSNIWRRHENYIETEDMKLEKIVYESVLAYKNRKILAALDNIRDKLKKAQDDKQFDNIPELQQQFILLSEKKKELSIALGKRIII